MNDLLIMISLLLLSLRADFIYHSTNGLETGIFIFNLTLFIYFLFKYYQDKNQDAVYGIRVIIAMFLVLLTRNDGFVYVGAVFFALTIVLIAGIRKSGFNSLLKTALLFGIPFVSIVGLIFLFRLFYFHDLFPNTFYVKIKNNSGMIYTVANWFHEMKYIKSTERYGITLFHYVMKSTWIVFLMAGLSVALITVLKILRTNKVVQNVFVLRSASDESRSVFSQFQAFLLLIIAGCVLSFYITHVGGDWMPGYRYIMHFYIILHLILTLSISKCWEIISLIKQLPRLAQFLLIAPVLFVFYHFYSFIDRDFNINSKMFYEIGNDYVIEDEYHDFYFFRSKHPLYHYFTLYADFALNIKEKLNPGDTVGLYEAGSIALFLGNDIKVIDIGGLNDRFIARNNKGEGDYSLCTAFLYYNCGTIRGEKDRYLVNSGAKMLIFDTFQILCKDKEELTGILGNHYILSDRYQPNELRFFTVYDRNPGF